MKGGKSDPKTVSLIIVYSLSKALGISPLEVYKMPANLIIDLLQVHQVFEEIKTEELKKASKAK